MNNTINGLYKKSALALSALTLTTFACALFAIPDSGAFAPGEAMQYPYLDSLAQFPVDYIWMYAALFMLGVFAVFMLAVHSKADDGIKVYTRIASAFGVFSAFLLMITYFIQAEVVPVSLALGQNEGIPLLTQYNPYGLFIAVEEFSFFIMSFSLFCLIPFYKKAYPAKKFVPVLLCVSFILVVISFILLTIMYGHERMDRFEVIVITVTWLEMIILGIVSFKYEKADKR